MLKGKVLVIENCPSIGTRINDLLVNIGYRTDDISFCYSPEQLKHFEEEKIEIILADLSLQESDCKDIVIKVQALYPYVPIIVLSEVSDLELMIAIAGQGAQDYLVKGNFSSIDLERAIRYAIERKKQDNNYKRLFADSPTPMYIYDEKTFQFLAVNTAALQQYGYTREEFLSMNSMQIRPVEDVRAFCKASSTGPEQYFDFGRWRHVKKNGAVFYVHIYANSTEFQGIKSRLILAVDIDKKVRAEKELEKKSKQLEKVIESITDGFFAINKDWNFTYVNKECERILQHERTELVGRCAWDLFPQGRNLKFYQEYSRAMEDQTNVHFEEFDPVYKVWVSASAYPTEQGLAVYFKDITQQKSLQEKIFNDEQNLRAIINNTKDVIWSIDQDFNIISANEAFWERISMITGKRVKEISTTDIEGILLNTWQQYFKKAFAGEAYKIIWKEHRDGHDMYEEVNFNPIRNKINEVIGISCFSRDITENQLHLNRIEQQNERLKKIAWSQSHELRKPVANILGLAELLEFEHVDDATKNLLDYIKSSAEELDSIIKVITSHTWMDGDAE